MKNSIYTSRPYALTGAELELILIALAQLQKKDGDIYDPSITDLYQRLKRLHAKHFKPDKPI